MDLDERIRAFGGGDPIAGMAALSDLVALGDSGEEALFANPIRLPTVQVRRRWLRYVASRPNSTGPRVLERLRHVGVFQDMYAAADLFAGLPPHHPTIRSVEADIDAKFKDGTPPLGFAEDFWGVAALFCASGAGGGDTDHLWHLVSHDSYAWEKVGTHAFRAACQAAARMGTSHLHALPLFEGNCHFTGRHWLPAAHGIHEEDNRQRCGTDCVSAAVARLCHDWNYSRTRTIFLVWPWQATESRSC
jgi:GNAT superfamily N-acetyltransferase